MGDEKKLRRHAWHLMSLSSGFQVVAFLGWIFTAMIGSGADEGAPLLFLSPMWRQWIELSNPSFLTILVAKFPEWLGAFWALYRLRRLGKVLSVEAPISAPVADSFAKLGDAVGWLMLLTAFGGPIAGGLMVSNDQGGPVIPLGLSGILLFGAMILVLKTIAIVIRQACRIDAENRSFV